MFTYLCFPTRDNSRWQVKQRTSHPFHLEQADATDWWWSPGMQQPLLPRVSLLANHASTF